MQLATRPVDSISDPRFAAEMAHARQVWLQTLEWRRIEAHVSTPPMRIVRVGDELLLPGDLPR